MDVDLSKPFEKYIVDSVIQQVISTFLPEVQVDTYNIIPKGWENVSVRVATSKEEVVLRFYALEHMDRPRPLDDILYSLEFMEYLYNHGIPLPQIFKTTNSEYITNVKLGEDIHYVAMFSYVPGNEISDYSENQIKVIAKVQAKMHTQAVNYHPTRNLSTVEVFDLKNWFNSLKASLPCEHGYADIMPRLEEYIQHGFERITPEALKNIPKVVIHGDINQGNLHFIDDKITGVFDFDDCHESVHLEDIGVFLANCLESLERKQMLSRIKSYFQTYHDFKAISLEERLFALCFCIEKWAITQYFFCVNDILEERPLDDPENLGYIDATLKNLTSLFNIIQTVENGKESLM